jgi:hypothetical protein
LIDKYASQKPFLPTVLRVTDLDGTDLGMLGTTTLPTVTASTATCRVAPALRRAARCGPSCSSLLRRARPWLHGCMQCSKGLGVGNPRLIRQNLMLPVLEDLYTQMGFEFNCRPAFMRTGIRVPGSDSGTGVASCLTSSRGAPATRDRDTTGSVGVDLTVIAYNYHDGRRVPHPRPRGKSHTC